MDNPRTISALAPHFALHAIERLHLVEASFCAVTNAATEIVIEIESMHEVLEQAGAALTRHEKQQRGHDWRAEQREAAKFRRRGR